MGRWTINDMARGRPPKTKSALAHRRTRFVSRTCQISLRKRQPGSLLRKLCVRRYQVVVGATLSFRICPINRYETYSYVHRVKAKQRARRTIERGISAPVGEGCPRVGIKKFSRLDINLSQNLIREDSFLTCSEKKICLLAFPHIVVVFFFHSHDKYSGLNWLIESSVIKMSADAFAGEHISDLSDFDDS